jgi:hypothetical protein
MANDSTVLPARAQQQVAQALEHDAEVMSNTQLKQQLSSQPARIQDEIVRINTDARHIALEVALIVPILAALLGLFNSFRMARLPDPVQTANVQGTAFG